MYNRPPGNNLVVGGLGGGRMKMIICGTTNSALRLAVKVLLMKIKLEEQGSPTHGTPWESRGRTNAEGSFGRILVIGVT
jgi:hypothetical protein